MQALKTDSEILIVGAGPTGLALAAELRGAAPVRFSSIDSRLARIRLALA